jgi:ABC-type bacteriocin/lantibiotic exporter with double-glycine peptidase domain
VPLFRDLNVCFKKGEFWAIAGPTGSGKTTILDLISGVLRPTVGKIVFDNIPLDEAKLSSLHQHIGYLTQNNFIFAGSILANISWGHEKELDSVKIENVVKISQMSDILKEKTLDFKVSESGQNLSGGQQQRIAITRTLLKDYDFILMDEPSSALDNETEKNFLEALSSLKGKIGIIMVTHRKEYFKHADYILEINGGCVEILSSKRE